MKLFLFFTIFLAQVIGNQPPKLKFNTCDFKQTKKDILELENVSILNYSIVNDPNKKNIFLGNYFLVKSPKGIFNVLYIFNQHSSDSTVKKYKAFDKWNFRKTKDTCIAFYAATDIKKKINNKYPVLIGQLFIYNH